MKILEQKDGWLDLVDHQIQRRQGVLGGGVAGLLRLDRGSGRDNSRAASPFKHLLLPPGGDLYQKILHPHLLVGDDVKNRVTRADENFDFAWEIHSTACSVGATPFRPQQNTVSIMPRSLTVPNSRQKACATRSGEVAEATEQLIPPAVGRSAAAPGDGGNRAAAFPPRNQIPTGAGLGSRPGSKPAGAPWWLPAAK